MKRNVSGWAELTVRNVACLAFGAALAGCASDSRPVVVGQPVTVATIDDYCAAAQKDIANSRVPARNVIMTDYAAFSRATPSVNPKTRRRPRGFSCGKYRRASSADTMQTFGRSAPSASVKRRPRTSGTRITRK